MANGNAHSEVYVYQGGELTVTIYNHPITKKWMARVFAHRFTRQTCEEGSNTRQGMLYDGTLGDWSDTAYNIGYWYEVELGDFEDALTPNIETIASLPNSETLNDTDDKFFIDGIDLETSTLCKHAETPLPCENIDWHVRGLWDYDSRVPPESPLYECCAEGTVYVGDTINLYDPCAHSDCSGILEDYESALYGLVTRDGRHFWIGQQYYWYNGTNNDSLTNSISKSAGYVSFTGTAQPVNTIYYDENGNRHYEPCNQWWGNYRILRTATADTYLGTFTVSDGTCASFSNFRLDTSFPTANYVYLDGYDLYLKYDAEDIPHLEYFTMSLAWVNICAMVKFTATIQDGHNCGGFDRVMVRHEQAGVAFSIDPNALCGSNETRAVTYGTFRDEEPVRVEGETNEQFIARVFWFLLGGNLVFRRDGRNNKMWFTPSHGFHYTGSTSTTVDTSRTGNQVNPTDATRATGMGTDTSDAYNWVKTCCPPDPLPECDCRDVILAHEIDLGTGWLTAEAALATFPWTFEFTEGDHCMGCELTYTVTGWGEDCSSIPTEITTCGGVLLGRCLRVELNAVCFSSEDIPVVPHEFLLALDIDTCTYDGYITLERGTLIGHGEVVNKILTLTIEYSGVGDGTTQTFTLDVSVGDWNNGAAATIEADAPYDGETFYVGSVTLTFIGLGKNSCRNELYQAVKCGICKDGDSPKYLYYTIDSLDDNPSDKCADDIGWWNYPLERDYYDPCRWTSGVIPAPCACIKTLKGTIIGISDNIIHIEFDVPHPFVAAWGAKINDGEADGFLQDGGNSSRIYLTIDGYCTEVTFAVNDSVTVTSEVATTDYSVELRASQDGCDSMLTATVTETDTNQWVKFKHAVASGSVVCDGTQYIFDFDSRSAEGEFMMVSETSRFMIFMGSNTKPKTEHWYDKMTWPSEITFNVSDDITTIDPIILSLTSGSYPLEGDCLPDPQYGATIMYRGYASTFVPLPEIGVIDHIIEVYCCVFSETCIRIHVVIRRRYTKDTYEWDIHCWSDAYSTRLIYDRIERDGIAIMGTILGLSMCESESAEIDYYYAPSCLGYYITKTDR